VCKVPRSVELDDDEIVLGDGLSVKLEWSSVNTYSLDSSSPVESATTREKTNIQDQSETLEAII
jgi:hypothetical protein